MRLESKPEVTEWIPLINIDQLNEIDELSKTKPVVIFKHSTSCGISAGANYRLSQGWDTINDKVTVYYLDLLTNRNISSEVESRYGIRHQSPQILLIKDGEVTYHTSHHQVSAETILEVV